MKRKCVLLVLVMCTAFMVGCSSGDSTEDEAEPMKVEVVKPDSGTVHVKDLKKSNSLNESLSDVEVDSENMESIEEVENTTEDTTFDTQVEEKIKEVYSQYGITEGIELGEKRYNQVDSFTVTASASNTTIVVEAKVDTTNGSVEAYYAGSSDGSDYLPIINSDMLGSDREDFNECLMYSDIEGVVTIEEVDGNKVNFSSNGSEYSLDLDSEEITER